MTERRKALANREVSVKEIAYDFFKHWRRLLVVMLAMGALAAGFSYIMTKIDEKKAAKADTEIVLDYPELSAEDETRIIQKLYEMPLEDLCALIDIDKQLDVQMVSSALAIFYADLADISSSFPANAVPIAELVYNVSDVSSTDAKAVADLFAKILSIDCVAQKMELSTGIAWPYYNAYYVEVGESVLGLTDSISFTLMSKDDESLHMYVDLLKQLIQLVETEVKNEVGEFSLSLVSEVMYKSTDSELYRTQLKNLLEEKENIIFYLTTANAFSTFQTVYYNRLSPIWLKQDFVDDVAKAYFVEQVETSKVKQTVLGVSARINKKLVLLALAAGLCVCAVISFIGQVFGNKLRNNDNPEEIFGVREIARIKLMSHSKGIFAKVDAAVFRLFHIKVAKQNDDYVLNRINAAISGADGDVMIAVNDLSNSQVVWLEKLCNAISKEGKAVKLIQNYLYDTGAYNDFAAGDNVILVGNVSSTLYDDVFEEISLADGMNKSKLGILIFAS